MSEKTDGWLTESELAELTGERGAVHLLGRTFDVDPSWLFRLVRCEVHLDAGALRCYALRRRLPDQQPLLAEIPYALPRRRFYE